MREEPLCLHAALFSSSWPCACVSKLYACFRPLSSLCPCSPVFASPFAPCSRAVPRPGAFVSISQRTAWLLPRPFLRGGAPAAAAASVAARTPSAGSSSSGARQSAGMAAVTRTASGPSATSMTPNPPAATGAGMSVARVYADANQRRPREYWDYENIGIEWGYVHSGCWMASPSTASVFLGPCSEPDRWLAFPLHPFAAFPNFRRVPTLSRVPALSLRSPTPPFRFVPQPPHR